MSDFLAQNLNIYETVLGTVTAACCYK